MLCCKPIPESEAKKLDSAAATALRAQMMSELGMDCFVAVDQPAQLAALEDKTAIPENIEKALVEGWGLHCVWSPNPLQCGWMQRDMPDLSIGCFRHALPEHMGS